MKPTPWLEEDVKDARRIAIDLQNDQSTLCIFLQSLIALREKHISMMKKARKEDIVWKQVGIIEGLDAAILYPHNIVKVWKEEEENFKNNGNGNGGDSEYAA